MELYRNLFTQYRTVLIGDLNSNAIWDSSHAAGLNHSALVKMLSELGLVSSYHFFHREAHGEEKQPTYYFQWKEHRPYHLDYCFIPEDWAPAVQRVEIGSYAEWKDRSDHRPLLVELYPDTKVRISKRHDGTGSDREDGCYVHFGEQRHLIFRPANSVSRGFANTITHEMMHVLSGDTSRDNSGFYSGPMISDQAIR